MAQLLDGGIEVPVEIYEGPIRPESLLEFFAGKDVSGSLQQEGEYLERLAVQMETDASPEDFL
jgi:hypothetical protein